MGKRRLLLIAVSDKKYGYGRVEHMVVHGIVGCGNDEDIQKDRRCGNLTVGKSVASEKPRAHKRKGD